MAVLFTKVQFITNDDHIASQITFVTLMPVFE